MNVDVDQRVDEIRRDLEEIELDVTTGYTLADAIREGSKVTQQCFNSFGTGQVACALSAAWIGAKARGHVS